MELVTPQIGLIFWTLVVFVLLLVLLKAYAWKPILTAVNNRNESIEKALQTAEKAKVEMENLNADNERILSEARKERDGILKEAENKVEEFAYINTKMIKKIENIYDMNKGNS